MTADEPLTQTLGPLGAPLAETICEVRGSFAPVTPGRFVVERELARGAYGRVMRAQDRELHRMVALKELLPGAAHARARFEREAMLAARLQHPSIIPVYDTGCWASGVPFIAMKLVTGASLQTRLDQVADAAERLALVPVVIGVAEAIAYAHAERVVHRDLKPANILVGEFGEVVVIDWGLAAELDSPRPHASPEGTPAYLAPEQASGAPPDERADVFALGAILYHVLAGRPPVPARSLEEAARVTPHPIPDTVPAELRAIVARAIARDPGARYPTARELAADLQRFQAGQLVSVHQYSVWSLLARFVRRNRAAVAIATILLAALAVVAVVSLQRIRRANDHALASAAQARAEAERATDALANKEAEERARRLAEHSRATAEVQRAATELLRVQAVSQLATDQTAIQQSREELIARNNQLQKALRLARAAFESARAHEAAERVASSNLETALARERARVKTLEDEKKGLATELP
jgi:hypothetical protein